MSQRPAGVEQLLLWKDATSAGLGAETGHGSGGNGSPTATTRRLGMPLVTRSRLPADGRRESIAL